jgi:tRNA-dihydrouridine synthase
LILIPQLLTNNAKDFIVAAKKLKEIGYDEVNFNLGCPSGTVVAKNKGSGFLALRKELNEFLDEVFAADLMKISIKTRIGKEHPDEFNELIEIYNRYPIAELIIHPRIQKDFYNNQPNMEVFREALAHSKNPVCYNGDIRTVQDYKKFIMEFPEVDKIMIGRGLVANPALAEEMLGGPKLEKNRLKEFHDRILEDYRKVLSGDRNTLFKMKELWYYLGSMFADSDKYVKKIKKSERIPAYEEAVAALFRDLELI